MIRFYFISLYTAKVSASEGSTDTAAVGAGAGAGVALLVILFGVAFVIYWRQRYY